MTANEFSNQFDALYNNISSNKAPGLNEYEKSYFLTKAQDEIVKNYFNPKSNSKQEGFDDTTKRQADFSMLMRNESQTQITSNITKYDPRALVFSMPSDMFLVINEELLYTQLSTEEGVDDTVLGIRQVIPINYQEYRTLMSKPFKEPLKYQAWRITTSVRNTGALAEIVITTADKKKYIVEGNDIKYNVRYIKRPRPILLSDFSDSFGEDVSIHGYNGSESYYANGNENPCELDPIIHEEILQRAVELAKIAWNGDIAVSIQTGNRSE